MVDAPCERMPLYVRGGSIVPTGKTIQSTAEPQQDLTIYVYGGADGDFTLYEDNGVTYAYENGEYTNIPMTYSEQNKAFTLGQRTGSYPDMFTDRTIDVVYVAPGQPKGKRTQVKYTGEPVTVNLN